MVDVSIGACPEIRLTAPSPAPADWVDPLRTSDSPASLSERAQSALRSAPPATYYDRLLPTLSPLPTVRSTSFSPTSLLLGRFPFGLLLSRYPLCMSLLSLSVNPARSGLSGSAAHPQSPPTTSPASLHLRHRSDPIHRVSGHRDPRPSS